MQALQTFSYSCARRVVIGSAKRITSRALEWAQEIATHQEATRPSERVIDERALGDNLKRVLAPSRRQLETRERFDPVGRPLPIGVEIPINIEEALPPDGLSPSRLILIRR